MIKFLPNFQALIIQNQLNSIRAGSNKKTPAVCTLLLSAFLVLTSGCTGPRLHSDLKDDHRILLRKWTLSTHGPFQMGDHGTEYSNPIVLENTLIFGNRSVGLVSLYPKINQQRWVLPIQGGVMSELTTDSQSVYFTGGDGFLYSANLETGRVNWRYDLRNPIASRPTIHGNRVFVTTSNDTVWAFDSQTGKWLWHYRRSSAATATILGASSPLVDGDEVLAGLSDGYLVALTLEEGHLKWEKRLHQAAKFTDVDAHPVLENGILYMPAYDGALHALKRENRDVLWRFDAGGSKDVVIDQQTLILPSSDGSVYSLQKDNAKINWKFDLDKGTPTQAIVTEKYVIVGSSYQYLYVIDKTTGIGVYRFNVGHGSGFAGSPAFDPATERLYILSGSGNLYAFSLRHPPHKIRPHGMTDPFTFQL